MICPSERPVGTRRFTWAIGVRILQSALLLLVVFRMSISVSAQQPQRQDDSALVREQDRPVADSHSFMELFTKLEDQLAHAVQGKDRSGLEPLLAPEFIVRNAEDAGHPALREAWISDAMTGPQIGSISNNTIAIRAFIGVAIVSFMQEEQQKVNGKDRTARFFIVDVWEVNHQHWQAAERFMSPVGGRSYEVHPAGNRIR
jgi:hypothetical protein